MEPRTGGRWYEIGEDGSECQWGDVLAWEPPARVLLAWRIGIDWRYDPALLTEVEIRFTPLGDKETRVERTSAAGEYGRDRGESAPGVRIRGRLEPTAVSSPETWVTECT